MSSEIKKLHTWLLVSSRKFYKFLSIYNQNSKMRPDKIPWLIPSSKGIRNFLTNEISSYKFLRKLKTDSNQSSNRESRQSSNKKNLIEWERT